MSEFCSNCPEKGHCVGDVTPNISSKYDESYDGSCYRVSVKVDFIDDDGMHNYTKKYYPKTNVLQTLDLDELDIAVGSLLVNRIGKCNGTNSSNTCPAINEYVVDQVVEIKAFDSRHVNRGDNNA